jgi:RimJ/RimL family protein N-acetyltransferase
MDTIIETERLVLRPFVADDLEPLHEILGDEETMRFYPAPFTLETTGDWIARNQRRYAEDGFGLWVVVERTTGAFLGDCGPTIQLVEDEPFVEIGWHVRRDRWGEGIAPEAGVACRDWVFEHLDLDRVISLIRPENVASCRVAEKLGMTVWRETTHAQMAHLVYAIDRSSQPRSRNT